MMLNTFSKEERGQVSMEVSRYNVDAQVMLLANAYTEELRKDSGYWTKVLAFQDGKEDRYPSLKKLVTSMITVFSGPLTEATFNIMDDVVENDLICTD